MSQGSQFSWQLKQLQSFIFKPIAFLKKRLQLTEVLC